jgi:DNA ligase-associated metallophosphoesterase
MGLLKPERLSHDDFSYQPVSICGKAFLAHKSGALYWPAEKALIVADLHLEKGSAYAGHGQLLPPYDTRETLLKLAQILDTFAAEAETVIALGDSFHDADAGARMNARDIEVLRILQEDREWIWIAGNHDPDIDKRLGGHILPELTVEGITLRHAPANGPVTHEIAAHLHPAARLVMHGTALRRPCFVGNGLRLVVPAFGAYTGGLNILNAAFEPLFDSDGFMVWMLGQEGLYPVPSRLLHDD